MPELTERQRTILLLLIRDYIETAQPVGSKRLVERFHLDLSPATVRNEMSALTEMGYLRQPHTSAGRVPAEEGYRVFVGQLLQKAELPASVQNTISNQFFRARPDVEQWMTLRRPYWHINHRVCRLSLRRMRRRSVSSISS